MFELYIVGGSSSRNRRRRYRHGYPSTSHLLEYLARLPATQSPLLDGRILRHALRNGQSINTIVQQTHQENRGHL
uniref:Uncharacterized protein n=1 Tax=Lutzomyia longipalpis TaxID=7200 RepID=A0A1B0CWU7_LUTLO